MWMEESPSNSLINKLYFEKFFVKFYALLVGKFVFELNDWMGIQDDPKAYKDSARI